jgi:hypothetical protein
VLSAAIALRIIMTAAGAPPPALWANVVPIADAACRPDASPCFVAAEIVVRNDFPVTMWLDSVEVLLSRDRPSAFVRAIDPPLRISAGNKATLPDVFELHGEGHHELRAGYHAQGDPPASRGSHVTVMSEHWLAEAALAGCLRCNDGPAERCLCRAADAGRRCTEPSRCQGVCLFDRFEEILPPVCHPRPQHACSAWVRNGFRIGHCSALKAPVGCLDVLTEQDSAARKIVLPAANARRCFDQAARVEPAPATGSSRRR